MRLPREQRRHAAARLLRRVLGDEEAHVDELGIFSGRAHGHADRGALLDLLPGTRDVPGAPIDAELIAYLLTEFLRERRSYLVLAKGDEGYVQWYAYSDGSLLMETESDHFTGDDRRLSAAQRARLANLGWRAPTCVWPTPERWEKLESPNYHVVLRPPIPVGSAALTIAHTLRDVVSVRRIDELRYLFFRKLVEDDGVGYLSASS